MIAMMFNKVEVAIAQPKNLELGCPTCGEIERLELFLEQVRCKRCGAIFALDDMELVRKPESKHAKGGREE